MLCSRPIHPKQNSPHTPEIRWAPGENRSFSFAILLAAHSDNVLEHVPERHKTFSLLMMYAEEIYNVYFLLFFRILPAGIIPAIVAPAPFCLFYFVSLKLVSSEN